MRNLSHKYFCKSHLCQYITIVICIILPIDPCQAKNDALPQDFDYSYYFDVILDAGYLWHINSTFHPFNYPAQDSSLTGSSASDAFSWLRRYIDDYASLTDKMKRNSADDLGVILIPGIGIAAQTGVSSIYDHVAIQPFIWTVASFRSNWYARLYIRATNEFESLPHYSGVTRDISRAGFNTGEIDQSVIGYQNEWTQVDYGRSREIWGPLTEDNLLLAGNAPAWERLMFQFHYKQFNYRWFYGFLETVSSEDNVNINRFIVGRALEYKSNHNLILSMGEVSVLAGPYRSLDWSFLNPIATHLEVEQNDRENIQGGNQSNVILFLNADWLPVPSLRLTGSFALDEFQIDQEDRDEGAFDALGFSGHVAWTPIRERIGLTLFSNYVRIGTYTLQHSYNFANLVTRGEMIGHPIGNDADDIALGIRLISPLPLLMELKFGERRWGDNSMLPAPYTGYSSAKRTRFPSGEVKTNRYVTIRVNSNLHKNLSVAVNGHLDLKHSGEDSALGVWTFSVRYQIPFLLTDL